MTLAEFLREWLTWVEQGAPNGEPYSRYNGLCGSSRAYGHDIYIDLREAFTLDGLSPDFPFGAKAYWKARAHHTMHRGRKRVAWVRSYLERHEHVAT